MRSEDPATDVRRTPQAAEAASVGVGVGSLAAAPGKTTLPVTPEFAAVERHRRNQRTLAAATATVIGMIGLSYAAVPLYNTFCKVTGYGGTTQVAKTAPVRVLDREIVVRFDGDVSKSLPWRFEPLEHKLKLKVGEEGMAFYRTTNVSDRPIVGKALFNVTPHKAGPYFSKVACFCFEEQLLMPGETVDMPVTFFVDPDIADSADTQDVRSITLSYSFFEEKEPSPEMAARLRRAVKQASVNSESRGIKSDDG